MSEWQKLTDVEKVVITLLLLPYTTLLSIMATVLTFKPQLMTPKGLLS